MTEALSKLEGNFLTEGEKKVIHWMLFNIILDDAMLEAFLLGKHKRIGVPCGQGFSFVYILRIYKNALHIVKTQYILAE